MAKRKTPQSSTRSSGNPSEASKFWEYRDLYSWQMKPINMAALERLSDDLRTWVGKDTSLRISDFYDDQGIHPDDYYDFCKRCPQLQASHEYALRKIASRREIGAITKKYDAGSILRSLSHYCGIDREQYEYRVKLAAQVKSETEKPIQNIIVLKDMPTTDKVPERKDKE